jgi:hypothetical protein
MIDSKIKNKKNAYDTFVQYFNDMLYQIDQQLIHVLYASLILLKKEKKL